MIGHPLVSICVPTYNGAKFLRQCIESVLAQSERDFEVVIVDDCSSDDTLAIAEGYAMADPRIRVTRNESNLGLVGNWNRCISLAQGEWIKFVFQDDTVYPDCVSEMLSAARDGVLLVACDRDLVFEAGTEERARVSYTEHRAMLKALFAAHPLLTPELCRERAIEQFGANLFGEPTSILLHRTAFERFGLFNSAIAMTCDSEMWIRVGIHTGAALVSKELATFRVHKAATSAFIRAEQLFRANILDNLVLLHQYAFDPVYAPVRRAAAMRVPPIDLEKTFKRRRNEARARVSWATRNSDNPDPSLEAQWRGICHMYPRIVGNEFAHLAWRWKRHFGPSKRAEWPSSASTFLD